MFVNEPSFSPQLFNNWHGLKRFMSGEHASETIKAILSDKKFLQAPIRRHYFNQWQVIWIVLKSPIEIIISKIFEGIAFALKLFKFEKSSRLFTILSLQMIRDWQQLCLQWGYHFRMIVPAYNIHNISSWDLFQHNSIAPESITSESTNKQKVLSLIYQCSDYKKGCLKKAMKEFFVQIEIKRQFNSPLCSDSPPTSILSKDERKEIFTQFETYLKNSIEEGINFLKGKFPDQSHQKAIQNLYLSLQAIEQVIAQYPKQIDLFSDKGLSRGGVIWFLRLYLKNCQFVKDQKKILFTIAQLFLGGVPKQGALLNQMIDTDELLEIKTKEVKPHYVSLYELDQNKEVVKEKINTLPIGVYQINVYRHCLAYIKISGQEGYIWNPFFGLHSASGENLFKMILKHHYIPKHPESKIQFIRYDA